MFLFPTMRRFLGESTEMFIVDQVRALVEEYGIFVMILALDLMLIVWCLCVRYMRVYFLPRSPRELCESSAIAVTDILSCAFMEMKGKVGQERQVILNKFKVQTEFYHRLILYLIAVALVLGLGGTIFQTIETFGWNGGWFFYREGFLGRIRENLFSTQISLIIASTAMVALRVIESKADQLRVHLRALYLWREEED